MSTIIAIVQARLGSTRLPGKVLRPLGPKPLLEHVLRRVSSCPQLGELIVATTTTSQDKALIDWVTQAGYQAFAGPEDDVLSRYYQAACAHPAEVIIRITADNPLVAPEAITAVIETYYSGGYDLVKIADAPLGVGVELFTFAALKAAQLAATTPYQREHVTPYIYDHPELFKTCSARLQPELSRPRLRLTVDTPADYKLLQLIYAELYAQAPAGIIPLKQVIEFCDQHPDARRLNGHIEQGNRHNS